MVIFNEEKVYSVVVRLVQQTQCNSNSTQIYSHIGNDYQGRPVLFFRSYGIAADDIKDIDLWVDYNLYMMDILMQDHMEGYVDNFIMLADYE